MVIKEGSIFKKIWGFPINIPILNGISPYKPTIFWGFPMEVLNDLDGNMALMKSLLIYQKLLMLVVIFHSEL